MATERSTPVDIHVGDRLRGRRAELGLSQSDLGRQLGVSFRQIQKYERGINRLGASRLYDAARVLGVGVDYFFTAMAPEVLATTATAVTASIDPATHAEIKREAVALVQAYQRIKDPRIRRRVQELARTLGTRNG